MKVKFVSDKGGILLRLLFIAAFFSLHAYLYFGSPLYKGEEAGKAAYSGDGFKLNLTGAVISRAQGDKIKIKAFALHPEIKIIVPENIPQRQIFFEIDNIGSHRAPLSSFLKNFKKLKNGVSFSLDVHVQGEFTVALPKNDSAKFNFAVMGDSRGSASPFANHRGAFFVFRRIITQAARTNPLFAMDLGDLVNSGKYYQYRILNSALRSMKNMVFLGVVGNHDLKNSGRRFWNILFGPPYYSFEHNGWRFIAVDNNAEDFGEEQFQWLEAELTRSS
ncbi:hypothetical protein FP828_10195, partial [bacterium]|nr:hypothetical protein [bacterium]